MSFDIVQHTGPKGITSQGGGNLMVVNFVWGGGGTPHIIFPQEYNLACQSPPSGEILFEKYFSHFGSESSCCQKLPKHQPGKLSWRIYRLACPVATSQGVGCHQRANAGVWQPPCLRPVCLEPCPYAELRVGRAVPDSRAPLSWMPRPADVVLVVDQRALIGGGISTGAIFRSKYSLREAVLQGGGVVCAFGYFQKSGGSDSLFP